MLSYTGPSKRSENTVDLVSQLKLNSSASKPEQNLTQTLSILYFNARSIANKISSLTITLKENKYDVVLISETWLKTEHLSSSILNATDYTMFRCDRIGKIGGGTTIIVKSEQ